MNEEYRYLEIENDGYETVVTITRRYTTEPKLIVRKYYPTRSSCDRLDALLREKKPTVRLFPNFIWVSVYFYRK